jgi:hypothetical protein
VPLMPPTTGRLRLPTTRTKSHSANSTGASQRLMRAEASTLAGLTALLRYVAPLLQVAGAPGLPIEVPFAGRWSAAFGTFSAHVADRLPAILAAPE